MKTYTVVVKLCHIYEGIEAKSKDEAKDKVLDGDWRGHDEADKPLEVEAKKE